MATDSKSVPRGSKVRDLAESNALPRPRVRSGAGLRDSVRNISFVGPMSPLRPARESGIGYMPGSPEAEQLPNPHLLDRLIIVAGHRQVRVWDGEWRPGFIPLQPGETDDGALGETAMRGTRGPALADSDSDSSSSEDDASQQDSARDAAHVSFQFASADIDHAAGASAAGMMSPVSRHFLRKQSHDQLLP